MNDEIKEILSYLKKKENTRNIKCITLYERTKLLDYITNLEQYYYDSVNKYEKLIEKYSNLQQENEKLKRLTNKDYTELNIAEMERTIYKSRIDKVLNI